MVIKSHRKSGKKGYKAAFAGLFSILILLSLFAGGIGLAQENETSGSIVLASAQTEEDMSPVEMFESRVYPYDDPVEVRYPDYGENSEISFEIKGFDAEKVIMDGQEVFFRLELENEAFTLDKGYPELPMIPRSIMRAPQG